MSCSIKEKGKSQHQGSARIIIPIENGGLDVPDGSFGDLTLVCSQFKDDRIWTDLSTISAATFQGQSIWLRSRVHRLRSQGKFAFIVLRRNFNTIQAVIEDGIFGMTRAAIKWTSKITNESVIDIYGDVTIVQSTVRGVTQNDVEIKIRKLFVVSSSSNTLPFQLEDASKPEISSTATSSSSSMSSTNIIVTQDVRLDNRWIDLRTPANHAIFKIQSRVCQYFRQFFLDHDFIEIHTPKLTPGVSEGGANVFQLDYFGTPACLAQSPQLYKQMSVIGDLMNVFEIGPVFRTEHSQTHRHVCEFTGMDFEMEIKQHYHEVIKVLGNLFIYIFDQLNLHCQIEINAIQTQYSFEPLQYLQETLIIPFPDAIKMLQNDGIDIGTFADFNTAQEKHLGKLVKLKYNTDFYIVDKYPRSARPFYTMPCPLDANYTNSYDVFIRGEEITSGAQRIHDYTMLKESIIACGIPVDSVAAYLESFKFGVFPHGGAGIGLERVVMLFLGLDNIRKTSLFPRTPTRLMP